MVRSRTAITFLSPHDISFFTFSTEDLLTPQTIEVELTHHPLCKKYTMSLISLAFNGSLRQPSPLVTACLVTFGSFFILVPNFLFCLAAICLASAIIAFANSSSVICYSKKKPPLSRRQGIRMELFNKTGSVHAENYIVIKTESCHLSSPNLILAVFVEGQISLHSCMVFHLCSYVSKMQCALT